MNCKQARTLFSPRVDNELDTSQSALLERHISVCAECRARWSSFESTVRMVHTLPQPSPDPSFVGQVLDRVRAYEAEQSQAAYRREEKSLLTRWRDLVGDWDWSRAWAPARLAGVVALGAMAGFVMVWSGLLPSVEQVSRVRLASGTSPSVAAAPAIPGAGSSAALVNPDRPFAQEAEMLRSANEAAKTDSAARPSNPREIVPPEFRPLDGQSRTQQVGLSGTSGPSPITF